MTADLRPRYPSTAYLAWVRQTYGGAAGEISHAILHRHVPRINWDANQFQQPDPGGDAE